MPSDRVLSFSFPFSHLVGQSGCISFFKTVIGTFSSIFFVCVYGGVAMVSRYS